MLRPNDTWNESAVSEDSVTGKLTRRLTCDGLYNETPTYHLNAAFSAPQSADTTDSNAH